MVQKSGLTFSVLSQFTLLTDGQTDRQTKFSLVDSICIPCSAVISKLNAKVKQCECKQFLQSPFLEVRSCRGKKSEDDIKDWKLIKFL